MVIGSFVLRSMSAGILPIVRIIFGFKISINLRVNGFDISISSSVGVRFPGARRGLAGKVKVFVSTDEFMARRIFFKSSPVGPDNGMPVLSSSEFGDSVITRSVGFFTPIPVIGCVANFERGLSLKSRIDC